MLQDISYLFNIRACIIALVNRQTDIPCLPAVADLPEFRGTGAERLRFIQLRSQASGNYDRIGRKLDFFPVLLCRNAIRKNAGTSHAGAGRNAKPFHFQQNCFVVKKRCITAQLRFHLKDGHFLTQFTQKDTFLTSNQASAQNDYILSNLFHMLMHPDCGNCDFKVHARHRRHDGIGADGTDDGVGPQAPCQFRRHTGIQHDGYLTPFHSPD